jgi:hypothetical protein
MIDQILRIFLLPFPINTSSIEVLPQLAAVESKNLRYPTERIQKESFILARESHPVTILEDDPAGRGKFGFINQF